MVKCIGTFWAVTRTEFYCLHLWPFRIARTNSEHNSHNLTSSKGYLLNKMKITLGIYNLIECWNEFPLQKQLVLTLVVTVSNYRLHTFKVSQFIRTKVKEYKSRDRNSTMNCWNYLLNGHGSVNARRKTCTIWATKVHIKKDWPYNKAEFDVHGTNPSSVNLIIYWTRTNR